MSREAEAQDMRKPIAVALTAMVVLALAAGAACRPRGGKAGGAATAPATKSVERTAGVEHARAENLRVRQAAVADLFYPADPAKLREDIDRYLGEVKHPRLEDVRAIICPHAGYQYSGAVAAYSYAQLRGRNVDTVIVLAPTHYAHFRSAYVSRADALETPLGRVMVSPLAGKLAAMAPFTSECSCEIKRPGWWRQTKMDIPPFGKDTPDTWEHALETQIPFIQRVLPEARVVPVVMGDVDPRQAADALAGFLNERTVIVASSDLSHYLPYNTARHLDQQCIAAIVDLDIDRMKTQQACGERPIMTVMHLARRFGWAAKLLDYRNSGDTAGEKESVVGYAAVAFYRSAAPRATMPATMPAERPYSRVERQFLLSLARLTITEAVVNGKLLQVDPATVPPRLAERKGCFVTLLKNGQLRGCIGNIMPTKMLYQAVVENAVMAALHDRRFTPVTRDELGQIVIEVSVLTVPQPLAFGSTDELLAKLRPGIDGVVLRVGEASATYLPQVWSQIPDKQEFLSKLSEKAGLAPDAWRGRDVQIEVYQDEAFRENE